MVERCWRAWACALVLVGVAEGVASQRDLTLPLLQEEAARFPVFFSIPEPRCVSLELSICLYIPACDIVRTHTCISEHIHACPIVHTYIYSCSCKSEHDNAAVDKNNNDSTTEKITISAWPPLTPDPVPPQSRAEQAAVVQRVGGEAGQLAPGPALRLGPPAQPEGHLPSPVQASKVQQ